MAHHCLWDTDHFCPLRRNIHCRLWSLVHTMETVQPTGPEDAHSVSVDGGQGCGYAQDPADSEENLRCWQPDTAAAIWGAKDRKQTFSSVSLSSEAQSTALQWLQLSPMATEAPSSRLRRFHTPKMCTCTRRACKLPLGVSVKSVPASHPLSAGKEIPVILMIQNHHMARENSKNSRWSK